MVGIGGVAQPEQGRDRRDDEEHLPAAQRGDLVIEPEHLGPPAGLADEHAGHSPTIGKWVKRADQPVASARAARAASSAVGSTVRCAPQRSQARYSRPRGSPARRGRRRGRGARGGRGRAPPASRGCGRPSARSERGSRPPMPSAICSAETGPSAAKSASRTSRRAEETAARARAAPRSRHRGFGPRRTRSGGSRSSRIPFRSRAGPLCRSLGQVFGARASTDQRVRARSRVIRRCGPPAGARP